MQTLTSLLKEGCPVHTGIAIFTSTIDLEGNLSVSVRVDKRIVSALNVPGSFLIVHVHASHRYATIGKD